jgi:Ca2+-binding RTX toxin-like protein
MPRSRSRIGRSAPDLMSPVLCADASEMHHSYRAVLWRLLPIALLVAFVAMAPRAQGATLHCTIRGTAGADTLTGTAGRDLICGKGGSDTLYGRGGDDLLIGGYGNDTLDGGSGNDVMKGSSGADNFVDLHGKDHIYGGDGNDPCMNGSDGAAGDALSGGPGKDGYNVDPGDTVAREPNDYWVDGKYCGGWDGHGPV